MPRSSWTRKLFPSAKDDFERAREDLKKHQDNVLLKSPAYRLAFDDEDFLLSEEMRAVRLLLELSKPELSFQEHGIDQTVAIYGSARTLEPDVATARLQKAQQDLSANPEDKALIHALSRAESGARHATYYQHARDMAARIVTESRQEHLPNLTVVTGGGPGVMEAANRGAADANGRSVGLNIVLPHEQAPNPYISPELCFQFHYFAIRKMHFLMRARALIVFPGGYGTLDELFETLTLIQTKKVKPIPVLIFGREYWQRLINFDVLVEDGTINQEDLDCFQYVDTVDDAWQIICDEVIADPSRNE